MDPDRMSEEAYNMWAANTVMENVQQIMAQDVSLPADLHTLEEEKQTATAAIQELRMNLQQQGAAGRIAFAPWQSHCEAGEGQPCFDISPEHSHCPACTPRAPICPSG